MVMWRSPIDPFLVAYGSITVVLTQLQTAANPRQQEEEKKDKN